MDSRDIGLLLILYLRGPQSSEQIATYQSSNVINRELAYWMPTDRGRAALALTETGEAWVKEAMRLVKENCIC